MWAILWLTCVIFTVPYVVLAQSASVELNDYSFDKIIDKFEATLVKFDVAFPYGDKHDTFESLAKEAKDVKDVLFAQVGVKDYGEKENAELAKKYGAGKDTFPVIKLFLKGKSKPISFKFENDFTTDNLRRFVQDNSGIHLSLPGCIKQLDILAIKFQNSKKEDKEKVLKESETVLEKLGTKDAAATGNIYITIMKKIMEKGDGFVASEISRMNKVLSGKVSKEKKKELGLKSNILQSFAFSSNNKKDEL